MIIRLFFLLIPYSHQINNGNCLIDDFAENQINLTNSLFEANTKFLDSLGNSKKYPELLANQTELVNSFNETFLPAAKTNGALIASIRNEYEKWVKKGFEKTANSEFFKGVVPFNGESSKASSTKKNTK